MKIVSFGRVLGCASVVAGLALTACGGGGGSTGPTDPSSTAGGTPAAGQPAPEFTAESVTGAGPTSLADAKGKVVILDFWGTFCKPCEKSFPKYQEIVDQMGGQVVVIAVSVDEPENAKKEDLEAFAKKTGVKFAILWDKDHSAAAKYHPPTMPTSFVIDKEGVIRHVHPKFEDGEELKIVEEVKALAAK